MAARGRTTTSLFAVAAMLGLAGCGVQFEPQSHVTTLRALGIQKSKPYARPGDTETLSLLWHDGSPNRGRPIAVNWVAGCKNPPGDEYYGCFAQFAQAGASGGIQQGEGNTFTFDLPDDIISSHGVSPDPRQPRYGVALVYFTLCAGKLEFATPTNAQDIPIRCLDAHENVLGSDDFVVGYTSIYAYENVTNDNPVITGFEWNGKPVTPDCIGTDCVTTKEAIPVPDCKISGTVCVPHCDGASCKSIPFRPIIDPRSAQIDTVGTLQSSSTLEEQMWVDYYVDRGKVKSDVRLLNDALKGFNTDYGTELTIPSEPGPLTIWSVAHDSRGGTQWARLTIGVE